MSPKWKARAYREQRAFESWLERREITLARRIGASRNKYVKAVAGGYAISPDSQWLLYERKHADEIEALLIRAYRTVIPEQGAKVLNNIRSMKLVSAYEGYYERLIQNWMVLNATDKAKSIAATAAADVRAAIERGIRDGRGSREIARSISKVSGLTASRALTIARTEIHGAAMFASETIAKQAQVDFGVVVTKHWISTLDERTRDAHAEMTPDDGVALEGDFIVGGVAMSRPGDPRGGAANVINCRCNMVYREVENDQGN